MPSLKRSWIELKRPTYLERELLSTQGWLDCKQIDDNLGGLWRVHDKLYDFKAFVSKHPGGAQWLEITKGTDCTEMFESHHLSGKAEAILPKYFIKQATTPRNSPYTFHDDGFYRTLKKEVYETLKTLPCKRLKITSKIIADSLVLMTLSMSIMAAWCGSYQIATLAGVLLSFCHTSSHNFFHQKDNWRMYYFNLGLLSVRDWRISHVLSHHAFTNSLLDLDYTASAPFFKYAPDPTKNWIQRYVSWAYYPLIHATKYHIEFFYRLIEGAFWKSDLIAAIIPTLLLMSNGGQIFPTVFMWTWIIMISSLGLNLTEIVTSHHHPGSFHEGDVPREDRDWGFAMIDTVRENKPLMENSLVAVMLFGDHVLHHLFPSVDHSILKYLYPVLMKTCKKFSIQLKFENTFELVTAEFQALARNKSNKIPPH